MSGLPEQKRVTKESLYCPKLSILSSTRWDLIQSMKWWEDSNAVPCRKNETLSTGWSQPLGTYDFVFFITLLRASRIFLHQVTCLFYMTRIKAKLTNTQPLGSSLGWLQMQWWYEDGFSSSVIPSWHFISMAHIYAWIQAVFHWAFIPRSEFKEMKPSIIIILFIKAKACNGT